MAQGLFKVLAVRDPRVMDTKRIEMEVINAMKKEGRLIQRDLESTVEYWVHKPQFRYIMHYKGGNITLDVGTFGSVRANKYWKYVNNGTLYRYVIFHPAYRTKTSYPGSFYTNTPGYIPPGGKIIGKSFVRLHGIRARNWTGLIYQMYRDAYAAVIQDAIEEGLRPK